MAKKKKLQPGDRIPLTDKQHEVLETIFKEVDNLNSALQTFARMHKDAQDRAWDAFYLLFPEYKDWNVRWVKKDKHLELMYPKSQ